MAALFALASAGGCRDQQSFVVVTAVSAEDTPITSVVDFVVVVGNKGNSTSLTYTVPANQSPLTISSASILDPKTGVAGKTFSVSFNIGRTGDTTFQVTARDAARCTIGLGQNHKSWPVAVSRQHHRPAHARERAVRERRRGRRQRQRRGVSGLRSRPRSPAARC